MLSAIRRLSNEVHSHLAGRDMILRHAEGNPWPLVDRVLRHARHGEEELAKLALKRKRILTRHRAHITNPLMSRLRKVKAVKRRRFIAILKRLSREPGRMVPSPPPGMYLGCYPKFRKGRPDNV